ncbi:Gram-positive signal peptide protein, YSIRK family [Fusobacterium sp. oral taxon C10]
MSPKEKVRANIYKALLEEEKRKNKRMSIFSIGLFFVGIVTMSTYNSLVKSVPNNENNIVASGEVREALLTSIYDNSSVIGTKTTQLNPDELFIYNSQI